MYGRHMSGISKIKNFLKAIDSQTSLNKHFHDKYCLLTKTKTKDISIFEFEFSLFSKFTQLVRLIFCSTNVYFF